MERKWRGKAGNNGANRGALKGTAENSMEARVFEPSAGAAFRFRGRDGF